MSTSENRCALDGYLVGADGEIPTDPAEFADPELGPIACSHLRCVRCGADVRTVASRNVPRGAKTTAEEVYGADDLASTPLLGPAPGLRFYGCRCRMTAIGFTTAMNDPSAEGTERPTVPWRCAGHPVVVLPHDFDGAPVGTPAELEALVQRALSGELPARARAADRKSALWLARLHARLTGSGLEKTVAQAARAALQDADARVRARALAFFAHRPDPDAAAAALSDFLAAPERFVGVADPVTFLTGNSTLEHSLWSIAAGQLAHAGPARDAARTAALSPGRGSVALFNALATADPAWLAEHAEDVARATPSLVDSLVRLCRARFPKSIPAEPVAERLKALGLAPPKRPPVKRSPPGG